jgi:hypothetical protein
MKVRRAPYACTRRLQDGVWSPLSAGGRTSNVIAYTRTDPIEHRATRRWPSRRADGDVALRGVDPSLLPEATTLAVDRMWWDTMVRCTADTVGPG